MYNPAQYLQDNTMTLILPTRFSSYYYYGYWNPVAVRGT
jgi:hypothetical protein